MTAPAATPDTSASSASVGVDPSIAPLTHDRDTAAAAILAAATGGGTVMDGAEALSTARADPDTELFGRTVDGVLVAVYALHSIEMAREVTHLAVAADRRRLGHGRACLTDALRRSGKRPLVVETDEDGLPFYRAVGFKLIGKRRNPSGATRYRLGWHAPRPPRPQSHPITLRAPSPPASAKEKRAGSPATPPA